MGPPLWGLRPKQTLPAAIDLCANEHVQDLRHSDLIQASNNRLQIKAEGFAKLRKSHFQASFHIPRHKEAQRKLVLNPSPLLSVPGGAWEDGKRGVFTQSEGVMLGPAVV